MQYLETGDTMELLLQRLEDHIKCKIVCLFIQSLHLIG